MNWFYDICAMIGSTGYASACVPVAWKTWKLGHSRHVPKSTIWLFFVSNTAYVGAMVGQFGFNPFFNTCGFVEIGCWGFALWRLYFPRVVPEPEFIGVGDCLREPGHDGPCNGLPMPDCNVWDESVGYARPFWMHPGNSYMKNQPYDDKI